MTDHKMLDLPGRFLLRPAVPDDLAALERLAHERAIGISSLPTDRAALLDKLERSAQAFASEEEASGEEIYLFVLEDRRAGRVDRREHEPVAGGTVPHLGLTNADAVRTSRRWRGTPAAPPRHPGTTGAGRERRGWDRGRGSGTSRTPRPG